MITQNIGVGTGAIYMVAQFLGGLVGGGLLKGSCGEHRDPTSPDSEVLGTMQTNYHSGIGLAEGVTAVNGFGLEFMGTFLLLFVVYHSAVVVGHLSGESNHSKEMLSGLAPIPIGFAVGVAHLTLGALTGCGINPARALGAVAWDPEFKASSDSGQGRAYGNFWIYFIGPFLASLLAPGAYVLLHKQQCCKRDSDNTEKESRSEQFDGLKLASVDAGGAERSLTVV
jgi:glycerol uptake facilitator-like aquaporin